MEKKICVCIKLLVIPLLNFVLEDLQDDMNGKKEARILGELCNDIIYMK